MGTQTSRQQRITMIAFMMQGIFFFTGNCFFDTNTVIPVFIETFTDRVELAGLAGTIRQFCTYFVQVSFGTYIIKIRNVPRYIGICLLIGYSMPLCVAAALGLRLGSTGILLVVLFGVAIMWLCDGLMVIGYYDLLGRTVSTENRGRVLGYQQLIGGIGALFAALFIKRILDWTVLNITVRYMLLFSVGGCILILGAVSMFFVKDVKTRQVSKCFSLSEQLRKIPSCFKYNRALPKVVICQICFTTAMMVSPYMLLLCKEQFGMSDQMVSTMLNFQVLGTLLGGAVSAFFAPKFGNKIIVTVYCVLAMICGMMGMLAIYNIGSMFVNAFIMVVTSGIATASWAGFYNVMIDIATEQDRHVYMLINSIVTLPLSGVGVVAGQIVKHAGYEMLLMISVCFAIGSLVASVFLMRSEKNEKKKSCGSRN